MAVATQPEPVETRTDGAFAALRETSFRTYWFGLIVYVVGWKFEEVTYLWLVWQLSQDPLALGALGLANAVPLISFQLFGGVLADRFNRLRLLVSTQAITGVILAVAAGLTISGQITVWMILVLSFLSGAFRAFEQPTRMALIPHIVSRPLLPNAMAIGSIPWQAGRIIGPSLGGILIAAFGPGLGLAVGAVAYFAAIGLYSRITIHGAASGGASASAWRSLLEGLDYIRRDSLITMLILLTFFNSLFGMSYVSLLPAFADASLATGAQGFGFLQAAGGAGAIIGSVLLAWFASRIRRRGMVMLLGSIAFGVALVMFSLAPSFWIALPLIFTMGFTNTFYLTSSQTLVQENVPDALRGRVMGTFGLAWNMIPLGGVIAGVLASTFDIRTALTIGGVIVTVTAVVMLATQPRLRNLNRA